MVPWLVIGQGFDCLYSQLLALVLKISKDFVSFTSIRHALAILCLMSYAIRSTVSWIILQYGEICETLQFPEHRTIAESYQRQRSE